MLTMSFLLYIVLHNLILIYIIGEEKVIRLRNLPLFDLQIKDIQVGCVLLLNAEFYL